MGVRFCFLFVSLFFLVELLTETGGSSLKPVLSGPGKAYLKSQAEFQCNVPGWSSPLTYELRKDSGELVATEESVTVTFYLKVTEGSEGRYFCRVTSGEQTSNTIHLQVVIPVQGTSLSSEPDPPIIYEGEKLTLTCLTRRGTDLSYTWYHNKQAVAAPSHLHRLSENTLTVDRASERHAGTYSCTAQNQMPTNPRYSSSRDLNVTVKEFISAPKLTFTVFYNHSVLLANITCRVARGSPPVTFRVLLDGREMGVKRVESLQTWFVLPVFVGLDMGAAQCKAETNTQQLLSDPVDLEVVAVGGAVHVTVSYLHSVDARVAAAQLKCVPSRGTFPSFSWSLNHSVLPPEGDSHAVSQHAQVLVLTDINAGSSGFYRCQVRDSFNSNSTWVESAAVLIQKTDLAPALMEIIALVFCGFLAVVIVGGSYCFLWNIHRGNAHSCKHHAEAVNQSERIHNTSDPLAETSTEPQAMEMQTVMEFPV